MLLLTLGMFAVLGLSLFRKLRALARELGDVSEQLGAVSASLQELAERDDEPAVFTPASRLRQEQILRERSRGARASAGRAGQKPQPGTRSTRSSGQRVR